MIRESSAPSGGSELGEGLKGLCENSKNKTLAAKEVAEKVEE